MYSPSPSPAPSQPATIPRPIHPSRKRRASPAPQSSAPNKRARKSDSVLSESSEPEIIAIETSSSGWVALKFVQLSPCKQEEVENSDNDRDVELSLARLSISPAPEPLIRDNSAELARSPLTEPRVLSPASRSVTPDPANTEPEDIWMIDGLDVRALLGGVFRTKGSAPPPKLSVNQERKILLWMKVNESRGKKGHEESYQNLLTELGFAGKGHGKAVEHTLRLKVVTKMRIFHANMKKMGIVENALPVASRSNPNGLKFAPYTDIWLRADWNGCMEMPAWWTAETTEVDHEIEDQEFSDDEPQEVAVGEAKLHVEPTKSRKRGAGASRPVIRPVKVIPTISVLNQVNNVWKKQILDIKAKTDVSRELPAKSVLSGNEWNIGAVQSQYAGVNMSEKMLSVDEGRDILGDTDYETEDEFRAAEHRRICTERRSRSVRHSPSSLYDMVNPTDLFPLSRAGAETIADMSPSSRNYQPRLANLFADHAPSSPSGPSVPTAPSYSELTDNETDDEESLHDSINENHSGTDGEVETADEEQEGSTDEEQEDFADQEDNADLPSEYQSPDEEMTDADAPLTGTSESFPPTATVQNHNDRVVPYQIIDLTCDSYPQWKSQMDSILLMLGSWDVIYNQGRVRVGEEKKEWDKKSSVVLGWMTLTMGIEARMAVGATRVTDPARLWGMLRDEFEVVG